MTQQPHTEVWRYREPFLDQLIRQTPHILQRQDPKTGRFGTGVWVVRDQNDIFPLAAVWSIPSPANPYYHDPDVLEAVMKGGDALIDAQDAQGKWIFRKKDDSTWGDIYMPWTYSRWIRAYSLIKDAMPVSRRERWEKALTLGYTGIAAHELDHIQNIPAHHAMGLYCAGMALGHPEWQRQAAEFMHKLVAAQDPGGFWSENYGPVVGYNFVYVDAVGVYYSLSHDPTVLPALERAARFHAAFTYPDGSAVETIDERQVYASGIQFPNVGFSFSPEGRGYARRQWERLKRHQTKTEGGPILGADVAASYLLYGAEGPTAPGIADRGDGTFVLGDRDALVRRAGSWFAVLSAYHTPVSPSRWIQDRQNLVSLFQDRVGLIVGGGDTKLQPLWSTFTVGDTSLLFHKPGDENPDFTPPKGLFHVPSAATLEPDTLTLQLVYGPAVPCRVQVSPGPGDTARLTYSCADPGAAAGMPIAAHVTLLPHLGKEWRTASGLSGKLGTHSIHLTSTETGGWFEHAGWRISLPPGSSLVWPVLPHDQYKKDGSATPSEGRLVLVLPLTPDQPRQEVTISVP